MLRTASGTVRFDLEHNDRHVDHWLVTIEAGDISVSRATRRADAIVRAHRAAFDKIAAGDSNAMAALLRGEVAVQGDLELVMLLQRLLPGPPGAGRFNRRSTQGDGDG